MNEDRGEERVAPLTGNDLIGAGWMPGPEIGAALKKAREYESRGVTDRGYLLKLLRRDFPPCKPKIALREEPVPFGEAIEATCELDEKNIASVRRFMRELLRAPVIERGAVMPDACPAGAAPATIPVGGAIAVRNAIIPSAHSADICCSMHATFFKCDLDTSTMLDALMQSTRFGMGGRRNDALVHHPVVDEDVWDNPFLQGLEQSARIHMADQGDGNHFAYIGRLSVQEGFVSALSDAGYGTIASPLADQGDCFVLVTHHGSRGLGAKVYARGQKEALHQMRKTAEGIPDAAAWLDYESQEGKNYWEALQYVSRWTKANHESIHARFLEKAGASMITAFGNEHNFVWKRGDLFLHGKGATPAWKDEDGRPLLGLIPLNMAAPILIVLGRDNPEFLSFCPHGAGRNLSRTALVRPFRDEEGEIDEKAVQRSIAETTKGLDVRWFYGKPDLSETPIGYKPAAQVREQIVKFGLADVIAEIEPLGCIMAGDSGPPPWIRRKQELTPKQLRAIGHRSDRRKERQRLHGRFEDSEEETG
jgi:RNA-splicing ligase RtcB